jgi:hypothetical protein
MVIRPVSPQRLITENTNQYSITYEGTFSTDQSLLSVNSMHKVDRSEV